MPMTYEQIWYNIPQDVIHLVLQERKFGNAKGKFELCRRVSLMRASDIREGNAYSSSRVLQKDYQAITQFAPEALVRRLLAEWQEHFFVSGDGRWLRSGRPVKGDSEIGALDAYRKYGAQILEAAEKGVAQVA
jgi:hypothetical protein